MRWNKIEMSFYYNIKNIFKNICILERGKFLKPKCASDIWRVKSLETRAGGSVAKWPL